MKLRIKLLLAGILPAPPLLAAEDAISAPALAWVVAGGTVVLVFVGLWLNARHKLSTIGIVLSQRSELATREAEAELDDVYQLDDHYFQAVYEELRRGDMRPGLWTKAFSMADGVPRRQKAIYVRLRVRQLASQGERPAAPAMSLPDKRYQLMFRGELRPGFEREVVHLAIASLLQLDPGALTDVFAGQRRLVMNDLDIRQAARQRGLFHDAGGVCHVLPSSPPQPAALPPAGR
ncbi:MAG: hypothetical protein LJE84_03525 [Gammaproteobacteria bacterium]|nr:hypothetical protein [Gammaproteobacteria bacterium]